MSKTEDFGMYLGVPTINVRVSKAIYQDVIASLDQKSWVGRLIRSLAGCMTLI